MKSQAIALLLVLLVQDPNGTLVLRNTTRSTRLSRRRHGRTDPAVILAAILVLVVGTIRLVGSNANTAFSAAASSIQ